MDSESPSDVDGITRVCQILVAALCMDHLRSGAKSRDDGSGSPGTTSELDETELRRDYRSSSG